MPRTLHADPELIADYACETGENPLWHPVEQRLYWLDIPRGRLFGYDPATGRHEVVFEADEAVGGMTLQADSGLLLFMARGAVRALHDGRLVTVIDEVPDERDTRFNDVIADPVGRVFCGTMPAGSRPGRLYRLNRDGSLHRILGGVGVSNGLGFTPDRTGLYYTDSPRRHIYLFDYDLETGALSRQRVFVETPDDGSAPDGLTVDADGYVWSARWDGSALYRYTPDGEEDFHVTFPTRKVSSLTFGGPDFTDIYVTTAGGDDKEENGALAGALFRLNVGIRGMPEFPSKIRLS